MNGPVYLAGPIAGCTDEEVHGWREHCKGLLNAATLDPTDRDYRGREDDHHKELVQRDMLDIAKAGMVLASWNPSGVMNPRVGTSMEIFFAAYVLHIPVYFVAPEDVQLSPWIRVFATKIFPTYGQACDWINQLDDPLQKETPL